MEHCDVCCIDPASVQASRSKFVAVSHKMTNEGNAQSGIALCAVCDVHARVVDALNSALSDWGLVEEPRNLLAPHHECDVSKQHSRACPFYDGWMEEVSYGLLTACSTSGGGLPPGIPADFVGQHRDSVERAALAVRLERQKARAASNPLAGQWELGAEAARILRRFFECCAPEEQESTRKRAALGQLVSLSYRIQGTPTSPAGLRRIVNSCLLAGQCGVTFMRVPERAELLRLLTQPIADVAKWVHRLEALWRTFPI
jgi:hypothetical protein